MNLTNFKWEQDEDGIVTLTWDMPGKPVNLLSMSAVADLSLVADALGADAEILHAARPGFKNQQPVPGRKGELRQGLHQHGDEPLP